MTTETNTTATEETIYAVVHFHDTDEVSIHPFRSRKDAEADLIETAQAELNWLKDDEDLVAEIGEEEYYDVDDAIGALKENPVNITINGNEDNIEISIRELKLK
jgi:hypothetical protein